MCFSGHWKTSKKLILNMSSSLMIDPTQIIYKIDDHPIDFLNEMK